MSGDDVTFRENLPSCLRVAVLDERRAWFLDAQQCGHPSSTRFSIAADTFIRWDEDWEYHPGCLTPTGSLMGPLEVRTDNPSEAEAAWVQAEHYVRTGELPIRLSSAAKKA